MKSSLKSICLVLCLSFLLFSTTSCAKGTPQSSFSGFAFNTFYDFTVYGEHTKTHSDIKEELASLEHIFSVTDRDALLAVFNESEERTLAVTDRHLAQCLKGALDYARITEGAFDLTLGTLREIWQIADASAPIPTPEEIAFALAHTGYSLVSYDEETGIFTRNDTALRLDLGGIAKGYAVEELALMLQHSGASGGIMDFGGTITVFGEKPDGTDFRIGIRSPYEEGGSAGYVTIRSDTAPITVSVSGLYERFKEIDGITYTHIFDSATGYPLPTETKNPDALLSAAVVSKSGAQSDALSTALLVMGKEKALAFCTEYAEALQFSAILFGADGEVTVRGAIDYTPLTQKGST